MDDETLEAAAKHVQAGDPEAAADVLRRSLETGPGTDEESRSRYLTHIMNLGDLLVHLEHYEEAEQVLRRGLQGRADLYGREHPGYAYGLEPLAEALLRSGQAKQALPLAEQAVEILWNHAHERTPELMTLRAYARKAVDAEADAFQDMEAMPDELIAVAIEASLTRATHDRETGRLVLADLRRWIDEHGRGTAQAAAVDEALASTENQVGRPDFDTDSDPASQ